MAFFVFPRYNSRKGTLRAYLLAWIVFVSSFLSGYDAGVAGGILSYKTFQKSFGFSMKHHSRISSLTVGLEQLGAFLAVFAALPLTNRYGRKWIIIGFTATFMLGALIQTFHTGNLGVWYFGRIVAGVGQGGQSFIVPMYTAEMTPKEIRGRCGSFYQWLYTWGVFVAYWVNYGVSHDGIQGSKEWQIPIGLEILWSGLMLLATLPLPESVRWLLTKDRPNEAWKSLTWIRGHDGSKTISEFQEITLGLRAEKKEKENFHIREIWHPLNRLRFFIGPMIFVFQNATGSSALAVFAPQYFALIAGDSGNRDLLLTALYGAVKVIASTIFIWVLSERFSRRWLLRFGAAAMAVCMLIINLIVQKDVTTVGDSVTAAGRAAVAMIYLDIIFYNFSWGPLPWAYAPEIFPTRIRSSGLAISMLAHWATSFCFQFSTPYMIANIGANTFLIFMSFDIVATIFCFFFVKETRGQFLERAAGTEWEVIQTAETPSGQASDYEKLTRKRSQAPLTKGLDVHRVRDNFGDTIGPHLRHRERVTNPGQTEAHPGRLVQPDEIASWSPADPEEIASWSPG